MVGLGVLLLSVALGTFIVRHRALEVELDRMLVESLETHTSLAGTRAGELIGDLAAVLGNTERLIQTSKRPPEKAWVEAAMRTAVLAGLQSEMDYLDLQDIARMEAGSEEQAVLQAALSEGPVVSGMISAPDQSESCILVVRPVEKDGQVVGVLRARLDADMLVQAENHSTFFQNVHCVIAGEDGLVVRGSVPETKGLSLVSLGRKNGISDREAQEFMAVYQENETGSFCYDPPGGRCYVAWAPISYNGWRVVQFSRSTSIQIERTSTVQTVIMLTSLGACVVLAVLIWRQRAKLAAERLRYVVLAEFQDTLIFEYDRKKDRMEFASNALDTLELDKARLEGFMEAGRSFPVFHPDDMDGVRQTLRAAGGMVPDQIEHDRVRLKKRGGEYSWYRSQFKAVSGPDGEITRVIGILTDISAQIDREIELRKQAQQDPLTGVYNRAGIKLINARLEQISRGVLFMMDLDDFKSINDNFGHAAGDKVLMAMGRVLNETFRTDDIVARVGGDEFVVFLSGSDSRALAEQKAQELLDRVKSLRLEGISAAISVSVGAATAPTCGRTYETLSAVADSALYQVKNSGKGGFAMQ